MHTSQIALQKVAKVRAARFPPPMWGRDRAGGGDETPSAKNSRTENVCLLGPHNKQMQCLLYPPPCPSPTWGEGTLLRRSAQPQAGIRIQAQRCAHALARKRGPRGQALIAFKEWDPASAGTNR